MIKNYNLKVFPQILLLFVLILSGCSNDDDDPAFDSFYNGALTSAKAKDLEGIWFIYEAEYQGEKVPVPATYQECGSDFFIFMENGKYKEYAFISSECDYTKNNINWSLNEGIVYIGPNVPRSDEMVLIGLSEEKLVFRIKLDIDEDGIPDILTFTAHRYTPPNNTDIYTSSFQWDNDSAHQNKIRFKWMTYQGFNNFDRYEIYRSTGDCSKTNAELIGTVTDIDQNFFIDEDPPALERICYFFRLYTDKGMVGESVLTDITTDYLRVSQVKLSTPTTTNDVIELHWETYEGNYFSHYEITVGAGDDDDYPRQEVVIAKIEDINTTTYTDDAPPYLIDPVYTVYVYNIFGQKSDITVGVNSQKAVYENPEVLPFNSIKFIAIDREETVIYLYAKSGLYGGNKLYRYNYNSHTIEAVAGTLPESYTSVRMEVIQSADHGKEVIFHQSDELYAYDARTLELKYKLKSDVYIFSDRFAYLHDNLWILTDTDDVYVCKREENTLKLIDKEPHFTTHHGATGYYIIPMNNNEAIVGHHMEPQSIKFTFDNNGQITARKNVDIGMKWSNNTLQISYNSEQHYLADFINKKLYTADDFTVLQSFAEPQFPSGISTAGNLILGSNNDPAWYPQNSSPHEKKAKIYDVSSRMVNNYNTKGYPHLLFENHLGQIVSISSGFKRDLLSNFAHQQDIFVEIIER
ncbi:lipocalin family protein [Sinomicrobium weinanense]|uniref:Lipocalin family protein n=1 Tax=Sinomicrobium weinanense TaxID=2842200 RepID=A0A926JW98_9FLAO|nr:lipocalin family protein [Sinomicrobium weinanense]MBC9798357.1 lipocalin family protein [Sinomicrobium weinanense]MBU3122432.1 lipocalin family protein [Sinomicrobium weinanense]